MSGGHYVSKLKLAYHPRVGGKMSKRHNLKARPGKAVCRGKHRAHGSINKFNYHQ